MTDVTGKEFRVTEQELLAGAKLAMQVHRMSDDGILASYYSDPRTGTMILIKEALPGGIVFFIKTPTEPLEQYGFPNYKIEWLPDDELSWPG